jgi:hypothetical protein
MYQPDRNHLDIPRLSADLRALAADAKALKRVLRTRWETPKAAEQRELVEVRRRTTQLCILRALLRQRFHLKSAPHEGSYPGLIWNQAEYHARVAERTAREYARPSTPEAVAE